MVYFMKMSAVWKLNKILIIIMIIIAILKNDII